MSSLTEPTAARAADLHAEQALVDAAYEHLGRMRAKAERLLAEMKGADPDLEWALVRRANALSSTTRALCFGRTDSTDGTTWYIGRRHVEDERGDPVVVEWRAPVALPFYRASWSDPMGLARRRQFVVDGRQNPLHRRRHLRRRTAVRERPERRRSAAGGAGEGAQR